MLALGEGLADLVPERVAGSAGSLLTELAGMSFWVVWEMKVSSFEPLLGLLRVVVIFVLLLVPYRTALTAGPSLG